MKVNVGKQDKMKHSKLAALLAAAGMCFLAGCGARLQLPEMPVVYQQAVGDEYTYLTEDNKVYVPYCPYESDLLGKCIGYCDIESMESGDTVRVYICELQGYSSDQWIVEVLDTGYTREGMILRELNATEIPEGLSSEYEWNRIDY
ncbi:MAG: hypothetical protein J1E01_12480 [Acetatifactor sp.]|nr:hypothetical protein [Acetatifactor sp.]